MTREDMIQSGKNIGAVHAVIRYPEDRRHPQVVYVLPGAELVAAVQQCIRGGFFEVIKLADHK